MYIYIYKLCLGIVLYISLQHQVINLVAGNTGTQSTNLVELFRVALEYILAY